MGFKPIFEEERLLFLEKTGIDLPTDCWRNGSKIYLDFTQDKPILQFRVESKEIVITKNNINGIKKGKTVVDLSIQKKIPELINTYKDELFQKYNKSVSILYDYLISNPNDLYVVSHSGGKDSDVVYEVFKEALGALKEHKPEIHSLINWNINFANTSNDTADTYKKIKKLPVERLRILNPQKGWRRWLVEDKNYFVPTTFVRNCCSVYKEGQITKAYNNKKKTTMILGVRSFESVKRSGYEFKMDYEWRINHFDKSTLPESWTNLAPIVEWKDEDVWLFILWKNFEFNKMYRYGFNRCGCLLCPYMSDYTDILVERYYPKQYDWWMSILEMNYKTWCIEDRLKWTLKEWQLGQWKQGKSKEYWLINKKETPERVKELAEMKGISEEMSQKYFNRKCACGKALNPTELAMYYKTFGRFEGREDNRTPLCKKCFCKELEITAKEYVSKVVKNTEDGCNLF